MSGLDLVGLRFGFRLLKPPPPPGGWLGGAGWLLKTSRDGANLAGLFLKQVL